MITVVFHTEFADGELVVWAESPELPGFSAAGESVGEVRAFVREHLANENIDDDVRETVEDPSNADDCALIVRLVIDGHEVELASEVEQIDLALATVRANLIDA